MYILRFTTILSSDVKADNLAVALPGNSTPQTHSYLQAVPSATYDPFINLKLSSQPIITVKSQPLPSFGLDPSLRDLRVQLIDYGAGEPWRHSSYLCYLQSANPVDKQVFSDHNYQPDAFRAPEIILGHSMTAAIDIWSLGCLVSSNNGLSDLASVYALASIARYSSSSPISICLASQTRIPLTFIYRISSNISDCSLQSSWRHVAAVKNISENMVNANLQNLFSFWFCLPRLLMSCVLRSSSSSHKPHSQQL